MILILFSLEYIFPNSAALIAAMMAKWLECVVISAVLLVSADSRFEIVSSIPRHFLKNSCLLDDGDKITFQYRVFNFNCNKKNLCSRENLSLLFSFSLEYIEELLDILFSTIANFPLVILLPLKSLFPKLPQCQFPKSGQILKMTFREKFEIKRLFAQDHDWEAF